MDAKKHKIFPLVETALEIRFPAELKIECKKDEYYEKVRSEFPSISVPIIDSPEPYPLKNYKFDNNSKTQSIQFSINKYSFHEKNYRGFQKFKV